MAVAASFVRPIHKDAGGAHDQKVTGALGSKVAQRSERLDGLAQAHLVSEHRLLLAEGELRPENLVAPE